MKQYVTCPFCGLVMAVNNLPETLHCLCKREVRPLLPLCAEQVACRIAVCKACKHYNNRRCVKISLGCKPAFDRVIQSPLGKCPIGKFGPATKAVDDGH